MSTDVETGAVGGARVLTPGRVAVAGFVCLFAAAGLLWTRYGPAIFVDGLNAVLNCF